MEVGEKVTFVGFNARPYETVGTITNVGNVYVTVHWHSLPVGVTKKLHSSQVKVIR